MAHLAWLLFSSIKTFVDFSKPRVFPHKNLNLSRSCVTLCVPMIVGTGVDITEVPRIQRLLSVYGARFLNRVFTFAEIRYCTGKPNAAERLAARFAAKEAGLKALGTGLRGGITWKDVEVVRLPGRRPQLSFHAKAAEIASRLGCKRTHLSLSHTRDQAIAHVILESE